MKIKKIVQVSVTILCIVIMILSNTIIAEAAEYEQSIAGIGDVTSICESTIDYLIEFKEIWETFTNDDVYTTTLVNIRTTDDVNKSDILMTAYPNTKLHRLTIGDNGWDKILINGIEYYIANEYITTEEPEVLSMDILKQLDNLRFDQEELRYMSSIIWAEAGNQCEAGQKAVGIIVMNRVFSEIFPDSIYEVIYQSDQFKPVSNGSMKTALKKYDNGEMPESCIDAAKYALLGNTCVWYDNATHNLKDYLYFARQLKGCQDKIEDHKFK